MGFTPEKERKIHIPEHTPIRTPKPVKTPKTPQKPREPVPA